MFITTRRKAGELVSDSSKDILMPCSEMAKNVDDLVSFGNCRLWEERPIVILVNFFGFKSSIGTLIRDRIYF
jgi:hypothetical protein